jgi:hypothetical protein
MKRHSLPALVAAALIVGGCSTTWDPHKPRTISAGPEGGDVTVEHGQRLRLQLPTDADWHRVEPQIQAVIPAAPRQGDVWMFTPVRSGKETLRLESPQGGSVTYQVSVPDSPSGLFALIWSGSRKKPASY